MNDDHELEYRYVLISITLTFPGDHQRCRLRNEQNRYVGLCEVLE